MTLKDLMASDVKNIVLRTDEGAETITYYPHGGTSRTVTAIRSGDSMHDFEETSYELSDRRRLIILTSNDSDGITSPNLKDHITVAGEIDELGRPLRWDFETVVDRTAAQVVTSWTATITRKVRREL